MARTIIEDATEMVANNLEDIDLSAFVKPIQNDSSFEDWLGSWG